MFKSIVDEKKAGFEWIDVVNPDKAELRLLSKKYKLHPAAVKDCLEPFHLPKFEKIDDIAFVVARAYDLEASLEADTIQSLTNKITIFIARDFIITVHRVDYPYFRRIKDEWSQFNEYDLESSYNHLLNQIFDSCIRTYESGISKGIDILEEYEKKIFIGTDDPSLIKKMYHIKRRASVFKRMLFLTKDVLERYQTYADNKDPFSQDLVDTSDTLFFLSDEMHENTNNLLNLHLSLSSHRTNEIMRVLTISSVFFWPLTFIVGVYGMNVPDMPGTSGPSSFWWICGAMAAITFAIFYAFRKRQWL